MKNRNIQMKKRNDSGDWDNLFPVTLSTNVFNNTGKSVSSQIAQIEQEREQIGSTVIHRTENLLVSQVNTPTGNISFTRDEEGVVQTTKEVNNDKTLKTTYVRDSDGAVQQIEREML